MATMVAKRAIKRAAGAASVALRPITTKAETAACVLMYHRLTPASIFDPWVDDWNVTPDAFERHVAMLADTTELVFLGDLPERLATRRPGARPLACLTFDDGYSSVHGSALPILRRYQVKASVFIVTSYIDSDRPMPFDCWGTRHEGQVSAAAWRALGWRELEACVASGLIEIGGHSHRHRNGALSTRAELDEEAGRSREILRERLGAEHARSYAYPYGSRRLGHVSADYIAAVRNSGYTVAASTNLGLADASSDPFELPRVEVCQSDGPAVVRAKVAGSLVPYTFTDRLRRPRR